MVYVFQGCQACLNVKQFFKGSEQILRELAFGIALKREIKAN